MRHGDSKRLLLRIFGGMIVAMVLAGTAAKAATPPQEPQGPILSPCDTCFRYYSPYACWAMGCH